LSPLVALHHGRIVKVMGDGVLVEFARPSMQWNAVEIAERHGRGQPILRKTGGLCSASASILVT
jgi:class 3 adenylate cyclase